MADLNGDFTPIELIYNEKREFVLDQTRKVRPTRMDETLSGIDTCSRLWGGQRTS